MQRAISAQQAFGGAVDHVIPTPEVLTVNDEEYDLLYPPTVVMPDDPIRVTLPTFEPDQPEYNMDSEDEQWFCQMKLHSNIDELKFESWIDILEKNSSESIVELSKAESILFGEKSDVISVYEYWLDKKYMTGKPLIPCVKTEKRDGSSGNNPYIAFRRRTEKMQTRKNRKNDETSYEKMLKLKREFSFIWYVV